jgi:acyl-CoA thioesterase
MSEAYDDERKEMAQRSARAMYERDTTSRALGMVLGPVSPGTAEMTMTVRKDMINGHGTCHGGYIFTLADSAFAFACNSHNKVSVAASADISFLKPARIGDRLTARGREIYLEGRNGIYDVEVRNQAGDVVAQFRGKSRTVRGEVVEPVSG